MQNNMVIKRLHCSFTALLLLLVLGFAVYQLYFNGPPDDELYSQRQLTNSTFLYVTKYKGGGATVSDVYRYYLDGNLQGDPMVYLKKREPFLVSDVGSADVSGYGNHINIKLTGRVYSFTNAELFYSDNVAVIPIISINANGVR